MMSDYDDSGVRPGTETLEGVESALRRGGARPPSPRAEQGIPELLAVVEAEQRSGSSTAPGRTCAGAPRRQGGLGGHGRSARRLLARVAAAASSRRLPAAAAELLQPPHPESRDRPLPRATGKREARRGLPGSGQGQAVLK